jgi:hypothetical protein
MTYTAIPLKVVKNTQWRSDIMEEVVEAVRCGAVPTVEIPTDDHPKVYGKRNLPWRKLWRPQQPEVTLMWLPALQRLS